MLTYCAAAPCLAFFVIARPRRIDLLRCALRASAPGSVVWCTSFRGRSIPSFGPGRACRRWCAHGFWSATLPDRSYLYTAIAACATLSLGFYPVGTFFHDIFPPKKKDYSYTESFFCSLLRPLTSPANSHQGGPQNSRASGFSLSISTLTVK